jgi:hypothetical protein
VGERYTVGTSGLHVSFHPSNEKDMEDEWYEAADKVVQEWFSECGWNGEAMSELLKVAYRDQRVDGEIFIIQTRKKLPLDLNGSKLNVFKPCLQMVESHRVESPWNRWDEAGLIDGVQFEKVQVEGRTLLQKLGYWIRNSSDTFEQNNSWFLIPAVNCWHIFNSHRVNQYRGLSDFYSVEVSINKMEDLFKIEMGAQATQSVRAVAIKNNAGQINPLDKKIEAINIARGITSNPNNGPSEMNPRFETYRKETGAYVYGLKNGEDVTFDAPNRPSEATLQLWEFLIASTCAGSHAPRCLVMQKLSAQSARSQGTEVRAELDSGDAFYKGDCQKWKKFVKEAVIFFMEWAVKNDPRVADPPSDWRSSIHVQQPEACNVDIGHTTQAQLMSLAAGTSDYDMILGPQGLNSITVLKKLARQQKLIEKLGIKITLPALMPGQIELSGENAEEKGKPQHA